MKTPGDIGRTARCFRGRWKIYILDEELFVYDQAAERLLKVRPEFAQLLVGGAGIEGRSVSSLLGVASKDG